MKNALKIRLKYKLDWLLSTKKASAFERIWHLQTETWIFIKAYPIETLQDQILENCEYEVSA